MQKLKEELKEVARAWGADLFGVADLAPARKFMEEQCSPLLAQFDRALAAAVYFPREVINELCYGPAHTYLHYYRVVNARLDDIALRLTGFLRERGWRAFPVPSSQRVSRDRLAGIFPHRLAAHLGGLGWIGKSCSLITPQFGPAVRLVTVLTDAPLPADRPLASRCGDCTRCVEVCPAGAIKGVPFAFGQELSERLQPELCDQHLNQVRGRFGKRVCGLCLAVCPWGQQRPRREVALAEEAEEVPGGGSAAPDAVNAESAEASAGRKGTEAAGSGLLPLSKIKQHWKVYYGKISCGELPSQGRQKGRQKAGREEEDDEV